jgi:hypothetical protein
MAGPTTLNGSVLESPPRGLMTCTLTKPTVVTRLAGTAAVSAVELLTVVVRAFPLNETCDPVTKFAPVTASVKPAEPAGMDGGERVLMVGGANWPQPSDAAAIANSMIRFADNPRIWAPLRSFSIIA